MLRMYTYKAELIIEGEVEAESTKEAERIVEGVLENASDIRIVEGLQVDGHPRDAEEYDDELWAKRKSSNLISIEREP